MSEFTEKLLEGFRSFLLDTNKQEEVKVYKEDEQLVPQAEDDGSVVIASGGMYGTYIDLDSRIKSDEEYISLVRNLSVEPEFDYAISEIVNELFVIDENENPVKIDLEQTELPDTVKSKIIKEFDNILMLLNFNARGYDISRQWYVDGKLYYHKIIDEKNPRQGIVELRNVDPRRIKKIKEVEREKNKDGVEIIKSQKDFFIFNGSGKDSIAGIKIHPDNICYITSGLKNPQTGAMVSHLYKAIKRYNQLRLLEESVIIYRFSRAPERRVFYVDVGNMPPKKGEKYIEDLIRRHRNKAVYDACLSLDTKVPLLDGRILTISEMQKEFEEGKQHWVYSCNPKTGKFVPGFVSSVGITKFDQDVMKITLDNGESVVCTYDHKFLTRDNRKVEAKDLFVGESLMPYYTRKKPISSLGNNYEQLFDNENEKWEFTHRLVSDWKKNYDFENEYIYNNEWKDEIKNVVHHKNYNRFNNDPENLVYMSKLDHFDYHKIHCSFAGKIGGKVTANKKRESGTPFFNMSHEERVEAGKRSGKIGGEKSYKNKRGIHALDKNEIKKNSRKGIEQRNELLKDQIYRSNFSNTMKNSLSNESTKKKMRLASKRNNNLKFTREKNVLNQTIFFPERMINIVSELIIQKKSKRDIVNYINSFQELVFEWRNVNSDKKIRGWKSDRGFNSSDVDKVCRKLGYNNYKNFYESVSCYNHKIVSIEYLKEKIDVGTLSIDKDEKYHDYHTFALACGVYTFNSSGTMSETKKYTSLLEDYWLARTGSGSGTKIETLSGSQLSNGMEDVNEFRKQFYLALNVPLSRLEPETGFSLGRASEISREEVKFARFCTRLRVRFSDLFDDLLQTQLILKNIISYEDWIKIKQKVKYRYNVDTHFKELLNQEVLQSRLRVVQDIIEFTPLGSKYPLFSLEWVKKHLLLQTEDEIQTIKEQCRIEFEEIARTGIVHPDDVAAQQHQAELQQNKVQEKQQ